MPETEHQEMNRLQLKKVTSSVFQRSLNVKSSSGKFSDELCKHETVLLTRNIEK